MVLVISSEQDGSTNDVIDWFTYLKIPFVRINETTKVEVDKFLISNKGTEVELLLNDSYHKNRVINLADINSVWYRRGELRIASKRFITKSLKNYRSSKVRFYLGREKEHIQHVIYWILNKKKHINSYFDDQEINKLKALIVADECGLAIPDTLTTSDKNQLVNFSTDNEYGIITKAIRYGALYFDDKSVGAGTEKFNVSKQNGSVSKRFFPSLFQTQLDKAYEVRAFYLDGEFSATAIFSQLDSQTTVDFRNYNYERPNRTPPFELPTDIKIKLTNLMNQLNLNSGSIDLVVTKNKKFVFLEVNPIGQFQQVSMPGNYFLERKIAKYLKNEAYS